MMNKRIKELAKNYLMYERFSRYGESTEEEYYDFLPEELEEFVQLIVLECVRISRTSTDGFAAGRRMEEHFGVAE